MAAAFGSSTGKAFIIWCVAFLLNLPAAGCSVVHKGTSLPSGNTAQAVSPNNTHADDRNHSLPRAIPILGMRQRRMRPQCARRLTPFTLLGSGVQCANFSLGEISPQPSPPFYEWKRGG